VRPRSRQPGLSQVLAALPGHTKSFGWRCEVLKALSRFLHGSRPRMSVPLQSDTHCSRASCTPAPGSPVRVSDGAATDVRLDDDEVAPDVGDGDVGHATAAQMCGLSSGSLA
jgi:hypothetical protein